MVASVWKSQDYDKQEAPPLVSSYRAGLTNSRIHSTITVSKLFTSKGHYTMYPQDSSLMEMVTDLGENKTRDTEVKFAKEILVVLK